MREHNVCCLSVQFGGVCWNGEAEQAAALTSPKARLRFCVQPSRTLGQC